MPLIAVIGGPTASGKSAIALRWAQARGFEILSVDSRQVYRGFSIGTGAPTEAEKALAPHHLVGHADPLEPFSPQRFRAEAQSLVESLPGTNFVVAGGTGLYLKEWMFPSRNDRGEVSAEIRAAAAQEIAERGAAAVHADLMERDPGGMSGVAPQDLYRIQKRLENWRQRGASYVQPVEDAPMNPVFENVPFVWLEPARADLHERIESRVRQMFDAGWVEEVHGLLKVYDPATTPAFNALGYREIADALQSDEDPSSEELLQKIVARTRQYAKKQMTFFRHQFTVKGANPQAISPADLAMRLETSGWSAKSLIEH